eukprot:TRINITY_DN504_c1_g1_i2.p1 TRINITY_DN504_c1_g1~~TRINITY_DN504_c1_g1_i2.p1  ORF type:complete len:318 (+),score=69.26 TRINITY_DN504_c1_g1_i2:124-1077(+)
MARGSNGGRRRPGGNTSNRNHSRSRGGSSGRSGGNGGGGGGDGGGPPRRTLKRKPRSNAPKRSPPSPPSEDIDIRYAGRADSSILGSPRSATITTVRDETASGVVHSHSADEPIEFNVGDLDAEGGEPDQFLRRVSGGGERVPESREGEKSERNLDAANGSPPSNTSTHDSTGENQKEIERDSESHRAALLPSTATKKFDAEVNATPPREIRDEELEGRGEGGGKTRQNRGSQVGPLIEDIDLRRERGSRGGPTRGSPPDRFPRNTKNNNSNNNNNNNHNRFPSNNNKNNHGGGSGGKFPRGLAYVPISRSTGPEGG